MFDFAVIATVLGVAILLTVSGIKISKEYQSAHDAEDWFFQR